MRLIAVTISLIAIIVPASAQFGNPGGLDPATRESAPGVPTPNQTNVQDRLFAMLAAQSGMAEVDLAKLAGQRSRNEDVAAFAKQMIQDHGKGNEKLSSLAKQAGIPLPNDLAADQKEA